MSWEVCIEWRGQTCLVGRLHAAERGPSASFEYAPDWLKRPGAFAVDPTSLPLQAGAQHSPALFGAIADCGPDRWGRILIERAVRKKVLAQKPYRDIDYVLALDDSSRLGALRFRVDGALASDSQKAAFKGRNGAGLCQRLRARADGRSRELAGEIDWQPKSGLQPTKRTPESAAAS